MIGRRAVIGLSLLCALLFSALGAQSASAAKGVNTTAYTCVKGAGDEDFSDAHCDTFVGKENGEYGHEAIALNETKKLDVVATSSVVLKAKAAGAAVEVSCATMNSTGAAEVHNVETEKKHTMTGIGMAQFSNCTVTKPPKCVVEEPIQVNAEFEGVEGLGPGKNEMGVEFKPAGGGGTFVELTFRDKNKGVEECNIEGKFPVTGTAIGTSSVSQTSKWTGAAIVFTDAMTTETLKFGPEKAGVELATTPKGAGGAELPIPITTVT